jgi:protein tyrosine phosphatase (PTP) superfamily phosphohydrolase (DUF442 family)
VGGAAVGLALAGAAEAGRVIAGRNFHAVVPGRVYRCAQLRPGALAGTVERYGIRTVINLRGFSGEFPWYQEECRVTHRLDVNQEDVAFSAARLPATGEVRQLIDVLDRTEYPVLLHCRQGADRSGLAAAVALLLHSDVSLEAARRQLGPRYGHFAVGRTAHLDRFFALYEGWLAGRGEGHSSASFREWALRHYCPGECCCEFEPLDLPSRIPKGEPAGIRLRVHNRSGSVWRMRAENHVGTHLGFVLKDAQERGVLSGRAGLFDARVPPGDHIDLTMVLPAVRRAGSYRLLVDMVDERHCWFYQTGSAPFEWDLDVHE